MASRVLQLRGRRLNEVRDRGVRAEKGRIEDCLGEN